MSLISEQGEEVCQSFLKKLENKKNLLVSYFFQPQQVWPHLLECAEFSCPCLSPFIWVHNFSVFCAMFVNLLDQKKFLFLSKFYGIKKKLLLFHKAVSVHGPSYWSSLLSAKEEDEYRSSRKSEILGWSKGGTGDLEHSWINSGIQKLNSFIFLKI